MVQGNGLQKNMNTTSHNFFQKNEPQHKNSSQDNFYQRQMSLPNYSMNANPLQNNINNFHSLNPLNSLTIPHHQAKNVISQATSHYTKETRATSPYRLPLESMMHINNNNSLTIQPNYSNLVNYKQTPQNDISSFNKKSTPINNSFTISASEFLQHANNLYQANSNKENLYNAKYQELQSSKFTPTNRIGQSTSRDTYKYNGASANVKDKQEQSGDIYVKVEEGFQQQPKPSTALKLVNLVIMEEQEEMARIHKQYLDSMHELSKRVRKI